MSKRTSRCAVSYIQALSICGVFLIVLLFPMGCEEGQDLQDFTSDGCSLFPDRSLVDEKDWCVCCFEHDLAYWKGGTEEERFLADVALRDCVLEKTGNKALAETMFEGVQFGGSPYFYNWYRWGYGWSYDRKYQKLNEAEEALVSAKLEAYFNQGNLGPCD